MQKVVGKDAERAQILYVVRIEVQVFEEFEHLLKTREDGKAAVVRIVAKKDVESHIGIAGHKAVIAVGHGHFIEIHDHGEVALIKLTHVFSPGPCPAACGLKDRRLAFSRLR